MPEYPLIEIGVSVGSQTFFGDALPDTGYDGTLIIPETLRREIDAPAVRRTILMADRHEVRVFSWRGTLHLGERSFRLRMHAFGDQFILGREVLDQTEICFEFGERVRLRFEREQAGGE
jgi:predicted aspartyl protease